MPLTFFEQMARCVRSRAPGLGRRPTGAAPRLRAGPPQTDARFVVLRRRAQPLLPPGEPAAHLRVPRAVTRQGATRLHVLPGYGHLDVFMGQRRGRRRVPDHRSASSSKRTVAVRSRNASSSRPGATPSSTASRFALPVNSDRLPGAVGGLPDRRGKARGAPAGQRDAPLAALGERALLRRSPSSTTGDRHRQVHRVQHRASPARTARTPAPPLAARSSSAGTTAPGSTSSTCPSAPRSRSRAARASGGCPSTRPISTSSSASDR